MCQICTLQTISTRDRWPKPVEPSVAALNTLITASHNAYTTYGIQKSTNKSLPIPVSLLTILRALAAKIQTLEDERQAWWSSPEKRAQRERMKEEGEQKKLAELHKINNTAAENVEAMKARFGMFLRWGVGMVGGVEELARGENGN